MSRVSASRRRRNSEHEWTLFAGGVALASVLLLLVALTRPQARPVLSFGAAATAEVVAQPEPGFVPVEQAPVGLPASAPEVLPASTSVPAAPVMQGGVAVGSAPILMYHYVRAVDQGADPMGWELSVTPELFDQQMAALAQQGYSGVRMDVLARCMRGEPLCPARPVALTFDDGYEDAYSAALPVLQHYGFGATFYIVSGFVGQPGYMSWEQLAALRDAGMEIGSHSVSHPDLTTLDLAELGRQVSEPKTEIEARLGVRVVSFCYPAGQYNGAVLEAVRAAGYESATTTRWDNDYSDPLALPRRRVSGGTTGDEVGWIAAN